MFLSYKHQPEDLFGERKEIFFILKYIDNTKIVFLSLFLIIEMICPKLWAKIQLKNEKSPLPVDVRHSKASLLKFTDTKLYN